VGGFIAYGGVQALALRLLGGKNQPEKETARQAVFWEGPLVPIAFSLSAAALLAGGSAPWLTLTLVIGLLLFGFVFAVNSSVHSYFFLAFRSAERITWDVGFYYMATLRAA
jgi:hypothetical protein